MKLVDKIQGSRPEPVSSRGPLALQDLLRNVTDHKVFAVLFTSSAPSRGPSIAPHTLNCQGDRDAVQRFSEVGRGVHEYRSGSNPAPRVTETTWIQWVPLYRIAILVRGLLVWLHCLNLHQKPWSLSASYYASGTKNLYAVTNTQWLFSHWTCYEISTASPTYKDHRQDAELCLRNVAWGLLKGVVICGHPASLPRTPQWWYRRLMSFQIWTNISWSSIQLPLSSGFVVLSLLYDCSDSNMS